MFPTVRQIREQFLAAAPWVNPKTTVDQIEFGDPDRPVRRIVTAWSACRPNIIAAGEAGADLLIAHEPTFCEVWDPELRLRDTVWGRACQKTLAEYDLTLMALHDTWDYWPTYGIGDALQRFLGFESATLHPRGSARTGRAISDVRPPLRLCPVPETTLADLAADVARRTAAIGGQGAVIMGQPDAPVRSVAIGVGCQIPTFLMHEQGADALIVCFDGALQNATRLPLVDMGANIIVLEHGITEMPGMMRMVDYLTARYPEIVSSFVGHEHVSRIVTAGSPEPLCTG